MQRLIVSRSIIGAALVAALASPAFAQDSGRTLDSTRASADSVQKTGGHNWFVSLVRKIARRSDEPAAPDSTAMQDSTNASDSATDVVATEAAVSARTFKSKRDSLAWVSARNAADKANGYRVVVDLFSRRLAVIDHDDTVRVAPAATASNATLEYGGRVWRFETPRGVRVVRGKEKDPFWQPPEWAFAEAALENHLKLATLTPGRTVKLKDGTKLLTRGEEVGIIKPGTTEFLPLELNEYVVFDKTLFVPPPGTRQRKIEGMLGKYRLDLGDGYLLHGTPYQKSIGQAVTHGCVRLQDEDIEWLYENVPVGTKVYIY